MLTALLLSLVAGDRPNVLLAIADDASFPHTSAYGTPQVQTPAFDRVAGGGVLFTNAVAASPGCAPSRAALLTGRHAWSLEQAGTHASSFPARFETYPDRLAAAGYHVGYTGKGWGPGRWNVDEVGARPTNPAGPAYNRRKAKPPSSGISGRDYAANFADFLDERPDGEPFCFWYGGQEPHRAYEEGYGERLGKRPEDVELPSFLPDRPIVRIDMLDYFAEIEHFDRHLGRMLNLLEDCGELANTLVIVTADNGMPFPRAKANCYDAGLHVPLAVMWADEIPRGRTVEDVVGFVDLTATIDDAAGVAFGEGYDAHGTSLLPLLRSDAAGLIDSTRTAFGHRERHSSSRHANAGYPQRAVRTRRHLYIDNLRPGRWPAGDPRKIEGGELGPMHGGYHDIDACPTLSLLTENAGDPTLGHFLELAVGKRPAVELYDVIEDPACLTNLAGCASVAAVQADLETALLRERQGTGDPSLSDPDAFEPYPRYSPIRTFPPPEE